VSNNYRIIVTNQPGAVKCKALRPRKIKQNIAGVMFCSCKSRISFISDKEKYNRLTPATNLSRSNSAWLAPGIHLACEPLVAVI
jgi:hypothetical protein